MNKILIVEDDYILSKAIDSALTDAGFETVLAMDGEEALEKVKKEQVDLVLLDLLLPKKLGEDVLAEIRKDEELKDLPIFITTVKSDMDSISRCTSLGILGYFIKSDYTLKEIVDKVRAALKKD